MFFFFLILLTEINLTNQYRPQTIITREWIVKRRPEGIWSFLEMPKLNYKKLIPGLNDLGTPFNVFLQRKILNSFWIKASVIETFQVN